MPARLHFTLATPVDANAIFDLVYKDPKPFLKSATLSDVQDWITNGSCWIVRDIGGAGIIGACNIRVPETNRYDEPEPAEFGGIFIHPEYRVRGISDALGVLTLASYFWDNDPESPNPIPIISHVHVQNPDPLGLLARLGFVFDKNVPVPRGTPGFEHMPVDENGQLWGKEFRWPPEGRIHLFREMAKLLATQQIDKYGVCVVPALAMVEPELERLAAHLEGLQTQQ
jgi:RimJ/RimL family protein N-acetyltransferase